MRQSGRGQRGGRERGKGRGRGKDDRASNVSKKMYFGIVISVKEMFGFLQPLLQVTAEEHLYFNMKDVTGEKLQEGDEVQYALMNGPRGYVAVNVRRLESGVKIRKSQVKGIIEKAADQYKFFPGLIAISEFPPFSIDGKELRLSSDSEGVAHSVPYMPADVSKSSRRVMKGDEVEFDLYCIPEYLPEVESPIVGYSRGHAIRVTRSRSDRLVAEQIAQFERDGVVREQGIINTIKNDFGFIRPSDRQDQVFFRLEDVIDTKEHLPNEGDEVEFYVISETVKGRIADRAVHLKYLPHGTVQFEETLGESIRAVVIIEPKLHPKEEPGLLHLFKPLDIARSDPINTVELWSRCVPEGMAVLKCGDELEVDVTKYRPENLIFARNVKIVHYRALGRVFGMICDIKQQGGYGFISSVQGDDDCYFRLSEVLGECGELISHNKFESGQLVSYEIINEPLRNGGVKLRAIRVQVCPDNKFYRRKSVLQSNVRGVIVRGAKKGNHGGVGSIQLTQELVDPGIACYDEFTSQQDMYCALQEFKDNKFLKEVTVGRFLPYQRYALHSLLRHHFTGIAHETVVNVSALNGSRKNDMKIGALTESNLNAINESGLSMDSPDGSCASSRDEKVTSEESARHLEIRIWKIEDPEEYKDWSTKNNTDFGESNMWNPPKTPNVVSFQKSDIDDGVAPCEGDEVLLDVCIDRATGLRVAANIRVCDVLAEGGDWPNVGIIDYVRSNGDERGGYIRCIPSNEKLKWNQHIKKSERSSRDRSPEWKPGRVVNFEIRVRGGVRFAAGVTLVPNESEIIQESAHVLDGHVEGVVVNKQICDDSEDPPIQSVYIVDISNCPELRYNIVDLKSAIDDLSKGKISNLPKNSPSDAASWDKMSLDNKIDQENNSCKEQGSTTVERDEKTKSKKEKHDAPSIQYHPLLPSAVVPVQEIGSVPDLSVGSLVKCRVKSNWLLQRSPLSVCDVSVISCMPNESESVKVKGIIIRLKINTNQGFNMAEISLNEEYRKRAEEVGDADADKSNSSWDYNNYYCDIREFRANETVGKKGAPLVAHVGDLVEFIPVAKYQIAACATIVKPRAGPASSLPPAKRSVINSSLQGGTSGVKSITMAQGPEGDSIGFKPGWRGDVYVSELPWGHLLSHLSQETPAEESTAENVEE